MRATSAFALLLALPTPSASLAVGAGAVSAPRAPVHAPIRAAATFAPGILVSGRSRVRSARMEAFSFDPFDRSVFRILMDAQSEARGLTLNAHPSGKLNDRWRLNITCGMKLSLNSRELFSLSDQAFTAVTQTIPGFFVLNLDG